ncbi:BRO family protein [Fibrobacter sp.]|uniref:BRO family protein n=1 Tax=Fibrobacter sp. TaxID=35828 RepID=UPI00386E94AD
MTQKEVTAYSQQTFESIKHIDENGAEFWLARELQIALEYAQWRRFQESVERAKTACEASGLNVADHFADVGKMIDLAKEAQREIADIKLSRYACYLIVMNGDPRKKVVALSKTYFAIMTCRNINGLGMKDIHKRKGLKKNEQILDHMGATELAANLFRITQTDDKLRRENIKGKEKANETHFAVGKKVRQTIAELGGTMPENLPTPEKSAKLLKKERLKRVARK